LWLEEGELLPGVGDEVAELELETDHRRRRRSPFEASEEEPLDRLAVGGGLRKDLPEDDGRLGDRGTGPDLEAESQLGRPGRQTSSRDLPGEGGDEAMEDEPKGVEALDGRLEVEAEGEALRPPPGLGRLDLLADGASVDPHPLGTEAGDEGRPR
jgi:hypothetical protein